MGAQLTRLAQHVWRRRWVVLVFVAATVAAAALSTILARPHFVGKAALVVSSPGTMTQQDALLVGGYVTLFNDPATIERLRADRRISSDVAFDGHAAASSPILSIEATADTPTAAQDAAELMAEAFRDDINSVRKAGSKGAIDELQRQLEELKSQPAPPDSPNATQIARLETRIDDVQFDSTSQLQNLQLRAGVSEITKPIAQNVLLGLGAGTVLGVLAALGLAAVSSRLVDSQDMQEKTGIVPLVEIPDATSARRRLVRADRLRRLWNFITVERVDERSVMAITGTGGSSAARTLGRLLAQLSAGQRSTVLVFADNAGGDQRPGFNEALSNSRVTDALLRTDADTSLRILTAGEFVADRYGLMSRDRVTKVIDALRSTAEMTIVVAPSIMDAPEAELLCGAVDSTLLVVDGRTARAADLKFATKRLAKTRAELLGTVLLHGAGDDGTSATERRGHASTPRDADVTANLEQLPT